MADLRGFNAEEQGDMLDFDPIPEGRYLAVITTSNLQDTKSGEGKYLKLEFQILEGEHKGRKLWANLNLMNPSEEAVRIAKCELGTICKAVGVITPADSSELHDLPLVLSVKLERRKDTDGLSNRIKGYFPKSTWKGPEGTPAKQGQPSSAGGSKLWGKR